jgi:hypothetical protein
MHRLASHKLNSEISNLKCRNQNVHNGFTRRNISDLEHSVSLFTNFLGFFHFSLFLSGQQLASPVWLTASSHRRK